MQGSSLQLKMKLLRALKSGGIEEVHQIINQIRSVTKVNPELYEKFHTFVLENKPGLLEMEQEQREENQGPRIVIENIEGNLEDDNSDGSWTDSSSSDQQIEDFPVLKQCSKNKSANQKSMKANSFAKKAPTISSTNKVRKPWKGKN